MQKTLVAEGFDGLAIGKKITKTLEAAKEYSKVNRSILIRGERGTGKELLARFIHNNSNRSEQPFIAINCAAFTMELLNSEIYGHEQGAFTGANQKRIGRLEQADKGTLFLDEIGNMPIAFQENILRVLEYKSFERIGGNKNIKVDVRFISATNANLEEMIDKGKFRADLFDRLAFAQIEIPPLRQRRDEIPELLMFIVQQLQTEMPGLPTKRFSRDCVEALIDYHWPGNIRQFKNTIERLYLGPTPEIIEAQDLPSEMKSHESSQIFTDASFTQQVESFQRELLIHSLKKYNWKQTKAAENLDMSIDSFRHFYKKFKLDKEKIREKS
jgi:DNA-binding NtrC family response regulator